MSYQPEKAVRLLLESITTGTTVHGVQRHNSSVPREVSAKSRYGFFAAFS